MVGNIKRKREENVGPRKTRRISPDVKDVDENISHEEGDGTKSDEGVEEDEEGEWNGIELMENGNNHSESNNAADAQTGTKSNQPPTGAEVRTIKEAADLFRSSSFKLQIDALLPNVRPKMSRIPPLEQTLLSLHSFLTSLPPVKPQHPLQASRDLLKKGISVPYSLPLPSEDTNWKVAFDAPSAISLVGSWSNKLTVKEKDGLSFGVDLAVTMPEALFQEKDYLNGRFFHKRAFYLAIIAEAILNNTSGLAFDVFYKSIAEDARLTSVVLTPRKDESQNDFTKLNARINIIPVLPFSSPIPLHRLSPSHSNIRIAPSSSEAVEQNSATPLYNNSLLTAVTPKLHLLATYSYTQSVPAFRDAVTLLRVWANQRGFGEGKRMCVRGFEGRGPWWTALLGLLVAGHESTPQSLGKGNNRKRRPLGKGLSSYQLFKAALDFIATHDFKEPVYMKSKDGHRFLPDEYQENYEATFVDSSSTVNLLAGIPLSSLDVLRHDAKKTLEVLDQPPLSCEPFTEVFLKEQRDLPARFDAIMRVNLSSAALSGSLTSAILDCGSSANALMSSLASILRRGLGNRVKAVAILHPTTTVRPLSQAHPSTPHVIHVGLVHDPEHAFRLVDHGPSADEQDQSIVKAFRDLWGDKAELRRFKDGRIVESVVWDVKTSDERTHIPTMVVQHILGLHFGIKPAAVQTWQTDFDHILRLPEAISSVHSSNGAATGFKGALEAFDSLVKGIKAVEDKLPLSILNISAASEYLRYTSVFAPLPLPVSLAPLLPSHARYIPTIEIVLEFEKSSKWPDDLRAIQKIKLAFFERIAAVLMSSIKGLKANVVIGDSLVESEIQDRARLEIFTQEGWAFSARIWHDREATLLDRIIDSKTSRLPRVVQNPEEPRGKDYRDALEARELYTRRFIHAPRHHRAIASLSHRFSAYAGTVRLVKRWLAAHWLLHGNISEEAVEILCAGLFVDGHKGNDGSPSSVRASVPGSKERGFAMVVELLKDWKFEDKEGKLFIPLFGPDAHGLSELSTSSSATSKVSVWAIATEADKDGHVWTSRGPDLLVAHRVRVLAKATWAHLQGIEKGNLDVKAMFTHPTEDYDFIVQLNPAVLPRYAQNATIDPALLSKSEKYANLAPEDQGLQLRPGFDPAQLLYDDLKRAYADTFRIFYDSFGGDRFGVVWDPSLRDPRPFRVLGGFSSLPSPKGNDKSKNKSLVTLNKSAVLSEIERLGLGIIKGITIHTKS